MKVSTGHRESRTLSNRGKRRLSVYLALTIAGCCLAATGCAKVQTGRSHLVFIHDSRDDHADLLVVSEDLFDRELREENEKIQKAGQKQFRTRLTKGASDELRDAYVKGSAVSENFGFELFGPNWRMLDAPDNPALKNSQRLDNQAWKTHVKVVDKYLFIDKNGTLCASQHIAITNFTAFLDKLNVASEVQCQESIDDLKSKPKPNFETTDMFMNDYLVQQLLNKAGEKTYRFKEGRFGIMMAGSDESLATAKRHFTSFTAMDLVGAMFEEGQRNDKPLEPMPEESFISLIERFEKHYKVDATKLKMFDEAITEWPVSIEQRPKRIIVWLGLGDNLPIILESSKYNPVYPAQQPLADEAKRLKITFAESHSVEEEIQTFLKKHKAADSRFKLAENTPATKAKSEPSN